TVGIVMNQTQVVAIRVIEPVIPDLRPSSLAEGVCFVGRLQDRAETRLRGGCRPTRDLGRFDVVEIVVSKSSTGAAGDLHAMSVVPSAFDEVVIDQSDGGTRRSIDVWDGDHGNIQPARHSLATHLHVMERAKTEFTRQWLLQDRYSIIVQRHCGSGVWVLVLVNVKPNPESPCKVCFLSNVKSVAVRDISSVDWIDGGYEEQTETIRRRTCGIEPHIELEH